MFPLISSLFKSNEIRPEHYYWHKCNKRLPVRLVTGRLSNSMGQLWRRMGPDGRWQYQQDPETEEEWDARQY